MNTKQKSRYIIVVLLLMCTALLLFLRPMSTYAYSYQCSDGTVEVTEEQRVQLNEKGMYEGDYTTEEVTNMIAVLSGSTSGTSSSTTDGGSTFIDNMLDTVFGVTDEDSTSAFSLNNMLDEGFEMINNTIEDLQDPSTDIGHLYLVLKAVAILIMTMYFISDLASRDYQRQFGKITVEIISKPFCKFIICIIFILNMDYIIQFFLYLSQYCFWSAPEITTTTADGYDYKQIVYDSVGYIKATDGNKLGLVDIFRNIVPMISIILTFIGPYLVSMVCSAVVIWVVYSRTVNIIIMTIGAPLAMSDIYGDRPFRETRSFGYIKELAGLMFQSVVIVLVMYAMNQISKYFFEAFKSLQDTSGGGGIALISSLAIRMTVFKVVQVGALLGSANKAKKLFASA